MSANWAEENLNTIRTLMERASVYRRALAPIAIGLLGLAAAGLAVAMGWIGEGRFAGYWLGVAAGTSTPDEVVDAVELRVRELAQTYEREVV